MARFKQMPAAKEANAKRLAPSIAHAVKPALLQPVQTKLVLVPKG
jgi:hypothetical protein